MQTRERAHCAHSVFPFIKKRGGQSGSEVGAARDRGGNRLCNRLWGGEVNAIRGEEDQNQGSGRNTNKEKDRSPERPGRGPAIRGDDHSCPIETE